MSLFERHDYQWRETYFVFFEEHRRPKTAEMRRLVQSLGDRFEVLEIRGDSKGHFESLTLVAPADFAGLDIVYCRQEDMESEKDDLIKELERSATTASARHKLEKLRRSTARFEVFHFEHVTATQEEDGEEELEHLDPGGLLTVLAKLADYTHGVSIDPQSGEFV